LRLASFRLPIRRSPPFCLGHNRLSGRPTPHYGFLLAFFILCYLGVSPLSDLRKSCVLIPWFFPSLTARPDAAYPLRGRCNVPPFPPVFFERLRNLYFLSAPRLNGPSLYLPPLPLLNGPNHGWVPPRCFPTTVDPAITTRYDSRKLPW